MEYKREMAVQDFSLSRRWRCGMEIEMGIRNSIAKKKERTKSNQKTGKIPADKPAEKKTAKGQIRDTNSRMI